MIEYKASRSDGARMTIRQIVEAQGLIFENYTVNTDDGYILEVHRVYGENGTEVKKPVVFM